MKLQVSVLEAKGLAGDRSPYVKVQLGRASSRTIAVARASNNPVWNEDFSFRVEDLEAEILITVLEEGFGDTFLGRVKLPVSKVFHSDKLTLPSVWYPLQRRSSNSRRRVSGEIFLSFSLYGGVSSANLQPRAASPARSSVSDHAAASVKTPSPLKVKSAEFGKKIAKIFKRQSKPRVHPSTTSSGSAPSDVSNDTSVMSDVVESDEEEAEVAFFGEESPMALNSDEALPPPLSGGILLDQTYATTMTNLNAVLFKPGSPFFKELLAVQKSSDPVETPWKKTRDEAPKRVVSYTKAATRLVGAVRATEEQTYLRADEKGYVVLASVSTPDVTYGKTFRTEVQYCMTPVLPDSGQENCQLRVSWRVNFVQPCLLKPAVESGARQGLKDSFQDYAEVLLKYVKPVSDEVKSEVYVPAAEPPAVSDRQLVWTYLCNWEVCLTLLLLAVTLLHICISQPGGQSGLEFGDIDLPDSFFELLVASLLAIFLERISRTASKFLKTRNGGDHGVKAKGEGWLLTVTLVEAQDLPLPDGSNVLDPYVVFTCSGRTRTSSVKLQTTNPKWAEIFEFDATEEPPSTLEVEVFNYDGPFPEAESLGCAEINFLRQGANELADMWVRLNGKLAQAHGSRVHLRVFLSNTKVSDDDDHMYYVRKVEKEVGSKIMKFSKNTSFQKLFSLPAEEFLINDFMCAIKRKIPLQGRLFLSPRMLGFYSNIFGHKTKFALLWEDIEEIQELPPSLANVGPSILVFTRKGRGHEANQGAKSVDAKGRLKFQFQSFVRPRPAFRTILLLWKNRFLTPEQQIEIVNAEHASDHEDSGEFLGVEDANLSEVFSTTDMPFTAVSMASVYVRENLEEKIVEKMGYMNYTVSPWESVNGNPLVQQRQVSYKLNRRMCQFGSAVSGTHQKETTADGHSFAVKMVLTLHDVPYGDHFQIQVRKEVSTLCHDPPRASFKMFVGLAWQKGTPLRKRITCNVLEQFTKYLKEELEITQKELLPFKDHHALVLV